MNVFEVTKTNKNCTTEEKHCAVVYLYRVKEFAIDKIAEVTEYAKSTIKNILRNEELLINKAKSLFDKVKTVFSGRTVDNGKEYYSLRGTIGSSKKNVDWNGFEEKAHEGFCAYVVELLDEAGNVIFTKVGYTANCLRRFVEHTGSYMGIWFCRVRQLFYFDSKYSALAGETRLRNLYKEKYPEDFLRNDRFTVYFDEAISL